VCSILCECTGLNFRHPLRIPARQPGLTVYYVGEDGIKRRSNPAAATPYFRLSTKISFLGSCLSVAPITC
jgi:hypothetical protein